MSIDRYRVDTRAMGQNVIVGVGSTRGSIKLGAGGLERVEQSGRLKALEGLRRKIAQFALEEQAIHALSGGASSEIKRGCVEGSRGSWREDDAAARVAFEDDRSVNGCGGRCGQVAHFSRRDFTRHAYSTLALLRLFVVRAQTEAATSPSSASASQPLSQRPHSPVSAFLFRFPAVKGHGASHLQEGC